MTALLFGCGAETATQGPAANEPPGVPAGIPMGRVGFNHDLNTNSKTAKVVLKTSSSTDTPVQAYDAASDSYANVSCTPTGNECASQPGSHCGAGGICVVTTPRYGIFYVSNFTVSDPLNFTFPVPCDGNVYAVEIYTEDATLLIRDMKTAPSVVVGTNCAITSGPTWADVTRPSLNLPTIYANLPAPYDTYTVGVNGLAYPFSRSFTMTSVQGTNPAVTAKSYSVAGALFASPTTNALINFTATFGLDSSILLSGDGSTSWQLPVLGNVTPTGSKQVGAP